MLTAEKLSLRIGPRQILSGIDLEIIPGQVTAILGPNGAGKTSLLRLLSGEWVPDEGKVFINGTYLQQIPIRHLGKIRSYLHQE